MASTGLFGDVRRNFGEILGGGVGDVARCVEKDDAPVLVSNNLVQLYEAHTMCVGTEIVSRKDKVSNGGMDGRISVRSHTYFLIVVSMLSKHPSVR